jgi:hypothetical protein
MNIWTSKGPLAAVALLTLTACEGGQAAVTGLLQRVSDAIPTSQRATPAASTALRQAAMANGAVMLVPPKGYCIDSASLDVTFALMSRCDAITTGQDSAEAPEGLLSISLTPASGNDLPQASAISAASGVTQVAEIQTTESSVTFRANGTPPDKSFAVQHWRGATVTGGYVLGLALYPAQSGRAITEDGRDMLIGLIRRTRTATP